jgi:hypothetical protein
MRTFSFFHSRLRIRTTDRRAINTKEIKRKRRRNFRTFLANSLDAWTPTTTFWDFLAADLTETKLAVNDEVKADIFILVFCV